MDHMERRQNEELMEARRLRRQEQKRKLLMRQRVLAAVLLVIFVLSLILILRGCRNRREHPELYAKKDTTLQLETEPDTTVTISAVGDIMICSPTRSSRTAAITLPRASRPCPAIRSRPI